MPICTHVKHGVNVNINDGPVDPVTFSAYLWEAPFCGSRVDCYSRLSKVFWLPILSLATADLCLHGSPKIGRGRANVATAATFYQASQERFIPKKKTHLILYRLCPHISYLIQLPDARGPLINLSSSSYRDLMAHYRVYKKNPHRGTLPQSCECLAHIDYPDLILITKLLVV